MSTKQQLFSEPHEITRNLTINKAGRSPEWIARAWLVENTLASLAEIFCLLSSLPARCNLCFCAACETVLITDDTGKFFDGTALFFNFLIQRQIL